MRRQFDNNNGKRFIKAKIPFNRKKLNGKPTLPKAVIRQNQLRGKFNSMIKQLSLTPTREIGTGIDYLHNFFMGKKRKTIRIDLKFSFGDLGEHVIKVRARNRKLINESEWIFAIDRESQIHIFPTKSLKQYVHANWENLSRKLVINKGSYQEMLVSLFDLYAKLGVKPIIAGLNTKEIIEALAKMKKQQFKEEKESIPQGTNGTINPLKQKRFLPVPRKPYLNPNLDQRRRIRMNGSLKIPGNR